jgi:hypothetical protein
MGKECLLVSSRKWVLVEGYFWGLLPRYFVFRNMVCYFGKSNDDFEDK